MKIEVGKYYRARNGSVFGPVKFKDNRYYVCGVGWYLPDGHYNWANKAPSDCDLIEEVLITPAPKKVKKTFYFNIYKNSCDIHGYKFIPQRNQEKAIENGTSIRGAVAVAVPIEFEVTE